MRLFPAAGAFALLAACTSYQPEGFTGGYSEIPLSANSYEITTRGNGFTTPARAQAITLVRAAELTLDRGYESFIITGKSDSIKHSTAVIGNGTYQSSTTMTGYSTGRSFYGNGSTTGTYTPPTVVDIDKPQSTVVVQMFQNGDPNAAYGLKPRDVIAQYGPVVGYSGKYAQATVPPAIDATKQ